MLSSSPRRLFKGARICAGLACIVWGSISLFAYFFPLLPGLSAAEWGIISAIVLLLPGGGWCIFLGIALLARDIPAAKRFELRLRSELDWLRARLEKRFPRFYGRVAIPVKRMREKLVQNLHRLYEGAIRKITVFFRGHKERNGKKKLVVAGFLATVSFLAVSVNAFERKPPLIIDFVVDPLVMEWAGESGHFNQAVEDIVHRASLIFNAEIGRRLVVGTIWMDSSRESAEHAVVVTSVIPWLAEGFKSKTSSRFIVFLTDRPIFLGSANLNGYNEGGGGRVAIVHYFGDNPQYTANILLHEIGHLCGARHSEKITSLMGASVSLIVSYEDEISIVREWCG